MKQTDIFGWFKFTTTTTTKSLSPIFWGGYMNLILLFNSILRVMLTLTEHILLHSLNDPSSFRSTLVLIALLTNILLLLLTGTGASIDLHRKYPNHLRRLPLILSSTGYWCRLWLPMNSHTSYPVFQLGSMKTPKFEVILSKFLPDTQAGPELWWNWSHC